MANKLPPELQQHPMFRQGGTFGVIAADHPRYQGESNHRGHEGLQEELKRLGLGHDPVALDYDGPERALVVQNPTREQMFHLGQRFGQETVIWGHNLHPGGQPHSELLYTNGPHAGKAHMPKSGEHVEYFPPGKKPENYWTELPGGKGDSVRFNYDKAKLYPVPLSVGTRHPQALGPAPTPRPDLHKSLEDAERRRKVKPHPNAYPWHDGHTQHNSTHMAPGAMLKNDGGRTDQSTMFDPARDLKGSFAKGDNIGGPNSAGDMSVPPPRGSFSHMANTRAHHEDGQLGKGAITDSQLGLQPQKGSFAKDEAPPEGPATKPFNDQAAGAGAADYKHFAAPFGHIDAQDPKELRHYRYEGKLPDVHRQARDHGFQTYFAGGKHGKPDLANKNYNTGHLMIYDPAAGSGGDFNDAGYTEAWRTQHELAHALTYPDINKLYGEGRRIGKLGTHRTLNEARRAVHWEWLAGHRQRELAKQMGVHISDEDFAREMNTIMHDAAYRAVTGKFTEPSQEGFHPNSHLVPLEVALGIVGDHARRLGLQDPHKTLGKSSQSTASAGVTEFAPMAKDGNDQKFFTPEQAVTLLAKTLHERISSYAGVIEALAKRETLAKSDAVCNHGLCTKKATVHSQKGSFCEAHYKPASEHQPHAYRQTEGHNAGTRGGPKCSICGEGIMHEAHDPPKGGWKKSEESAEPTEFTLKNPPKDTCDRCERHLSECPHPAGDAWRKKNKSTKKSEEGQSISTSPAPREQEVRDAKPAPSANSNFKIAWASFNHGRDTRKNMTGGSENLSSGTPGLMMSEGEAKPKTCDAKDHEGRPCLRPAGHESFHSAHDPKVHANRTWVDTKKSSMPAGNMAMPNPPSSMQMSAPQPENLRQKQAVPVKTDDPRSNKFVTAGNNQTPAIDKSEPKDAQGKTDGRHEPRVHVGHRQQGALAGDAKPQTHTHGIASGDVNKLKPLPAGSRSPSNKVVEKADVPMAKPPSGNASAAPIPQSKPTGGGMAKGLGASMMAGAHTGAIQGMQAAGARTAGHAQSVVTGGVLGGLKGALSAAMAHKAPAAGAAPAVAKKDPPWQQPGEKIRSPKTIGTSSPSHAVTPRLEGDDVHEFKRKMGVCMHPGCHNIKGHDGEHTKKAELEKGADIGSMKGAALQAAHQAAPGAAPSAATAKMPSPAEHAGRAQMFQGFMPAAGAGHQMAGAAKPAAPAMAKPAAAATPGPAAAPAKPAAPAAPAMQPKSTSTLRPPTPSAGPGALKPPAAGGALGHLPKLSAVLARPKPVAPALKQSEKDGKK